MPKIITIVREAATRVMTNRWSVACGECDVCNWNWPLSLNIQPSNNSSLPLPLSNRAGGAGSGDARRSDASAVASASSSPLVRYTDDSTTRPVRSTVNETTTNERSIACGVPFSTSDGLRSKIRCRDARLVLVERRAAHGRRRPAFDGLGRRRDRAGRDRYRDERGPQLLRVLPDRCGHDGPACRLAVHDTFMVVKSAGAHQCGAMRSGGTATC